MRSVGYPRRLSGEQAELGTAITTLSARLGRAPTASELAAEVDIDRDEVVAALVSESCHYDSDTTDQPVAARATPGDVEGFLRRIDDPARLRRLLNRMPQCDLTVLLLRLEQSLSPTEIAEKLGIPRTEVARRLGRSLASLRDQLR